MASGRNRRDLFQGRVVGRDHSEAGAEFDRHVADGEAAFHRKPTDGAARIFDRVSIAGRNADFADQAQDDVLALRAGREPTVERYAHRFRLALHAGLRRQDVGEFATADPPGQCTQRADGAAVAVSGDAGANGIRRQLSKATIFPTISALTPFLSSADS